MGKAKAVTKILTFPILSLGPLVHVLWLWSCLLIKNQILNNTIYRTLAYMQVTVAFWTDKFYLPNKDYSNNSMTEFKS